MLDDLVYSLTEFSFTMSVPGITWESLMVVLGWIA